MAEFGNNNVDLDIWVLFHILKDNLAVFEALGFPNSGLNLRWEDVVIFIFIKLLLMDISLRWKGSHKSIISSLEKDCILWTLLRGGGARILVLLTRMEYFFTTFPKKT